MEEGKHFKEMSKLAKKEITPPESSTSSAKWSPKKTKKTEIKNKKTFARLTMVSKERNKFKYGTESEERTTIQRTAPGIRVLPETRAFSGSKFQTLHDFEMSSLCCEECNDDSLSMISMNSRPSSAATDFPQKVNLGDENEPLSLENVNIDNVGWMRTAAAESPQSDLTLDEISVDSGSSRQQATHVENVNNDDKAKKCHFGSSSLPVHAEAERSKKKPENKSSKVKTAWQLNEKFLLTGDFPAEVWEENSNRKATNARRKSSDLLNASFPPLSLVPGLRRSSFPSSASSSLMFSAATCELPSLSGRQCKVQLPSSFPVVPPPLNASDSESESSVEEKLNHLFRDKEQLARKFHQNMQKNYLDIPSKRTKNLRNSSARSSPISSTAQSPMASTETLAIRAASTEYLAARVVTQLNSAFKETTIESNDDVTARENCVTPNLVPRRYSALSFRPNTSGCLDERRNSLNLPSVHNECSKSLPNLTDDKSKRMFVTFDQHFPQASVVDLKGKGDLAQRCRLINRRLSSEDAIVKAMLDTKIKKKSMVKKWVISSAQCP